MELDICLIEMIAVVKSMDFEIKWFKRKQKKMNAVPKGNYDWCVFHYTSDQENQVVYDTKDGCYTPYELE